MEITRRKKYTRKHKCRQFQVEFDSSSCINLEELSLFLKDCKENGANHIEVSVSHLDGYLEEMYLRAMLIELESDEEFEKRKKELELKRLEKEQQRRMIQDQKDLEVYKKLHEKFKHLNL